MRCERALLLPVLALAICGCQTSSYEVRVERVQAAPPPVIRETPRCKPLVPASFRAAKRWARQLYSDHRQSFYCGCAFGARMSLSAQQCGYQPKRRSIRAARVEWEHIVPAAAFGMQRSCWRYEQCHSRKGKAYGGRKCCRTIDAEFRQMEADLANLVPAVGELNAARSNFRFDVVQGEPREYGLCNFEVDSARRVAEPAPELRGEIARAYLYMFRTYGSQALPLSGTELERFAQWDRQDPPGPWERERAAGIAGLQHCPLSE